MDHFEQGTHEWLNTRLFRFTASELYKLMTRPKSGSGLAKTAESYIFDKLAEELTNGSCLDYNELDVKETRWGTANEEKAREEYKQRTGHKVDRVGFIPYNEYFGVSPDGLVGEDGGIEIKCPYKTAHHARNLLITSQDEFAKVRPEYFAQIQAGMLVTRRKWWDFVSYDPRCKNDLFMLKVVRIERDEAFIERAIEAIETARHEQESMMQKLVTFNLG